MFLRLVLSLVFSLPCIAQAGAGAGGGEFMGYRLGDVYQLTAATQRKITTTGNLLIAADQPVKPDDIASVTLLSTGETATIGYIAASQWFATEDAARDFGRRYFELLRVKYPDWSYGWEVMDAEMNVVEVSMRNAPYDLRLQLVHEQRAGDRPWRYTMTLGWMDASPEGNAWQNQAISEQIMLQEDARKKVLQEADTRGL